MTLRLLPQCVEKPQTDKNNLSREKIDYVSVPSREPLQVLLLRFRDSCSTFQHRLSIRFAAQIKITRCLIMANLKGIGRFKNEKKDIYMYSCDKYLVYSVLYNKCVYMCTCDKWPLWMTPRPAVAPNLAQLVARESQSRLSLRNRSMVVPLCMIAFANTTAPCPMLFLVSTLLFSSLKICKKDRILLAILTSLPDEDKTGDDSHQASFFECAPQKKELHEGRITFKHCLCVCKLESLEDLTKMCYCKARS